jgi:nicotinamide phosphoribosyltransferase
MENSNELQIDNLQLNRAQTRELGRKISRLTRGKVDLTSLLTGEDLVKTLDSILTGLEPNLITLADAYKYGHCVNYPDKLTKLVSYLESRGGKFEETVMFGLQYIIKKYLVGNVLSKEMIEEADQKLNGEGGVFTTPVFPKQQWLDLLEAYDGAIPVEIRAVAEGEVIPVKNVLMVIESTDDRFAWVTNFLETLLLQVWYPITVATLSREVKQIVVEYLTKTGAKKEDIPMMVQFILNDFGFRGVSSVESAGIGGASHLVNFMGSDNIAGSEMLQEFYQAEIMYGKSIIATEHSVMTLKGEEGELSIMKRFLDNNPTGIIACVSDSYHIFRACRDYWGTELRDQILAREGTLVIRPDSGHILRTLEEIFEILFEKFGYTVNVVDGKEFKVLPPQVRVLQGDGVNLDSIREMYEMLYDLGIGAENLVLGMGGKLLQAGIDRDTQNFAVKACYAVIDGVGVEVVKSPTEMDEKGVLHPSFKVSKKGELKLVEDGDSVKTVCSSQVSAEEFKSLECQLGLVLRNGVLYADHDIVDVRERADVDYDIDYSVQEKELV